MIPDIDLDECISIVEGWRENANKKLKETGNFEFVIIAHTYKEIYRHLNDYKKLKSSVGDSHDRETEKIS